MTLTRWLSYTNLTRYPLKMYSQTTQWTFYVTAFESCRNTDRQAYIQPAKLLPRLFVASDRPTHRSIRRTVATTGAERLRLKLHRSICKNVCTFSRGLRQDSRFSSKLQLLQIHCAASSSYTSEWQSIWNLTKLAVTSRERGYSSMCDRRCVCACVCATTWVTELLF